VIYDNAIDGLSEEDKQLPQIASLKPFLKRGIGIHHSGLLPILKEVTEILFGEGLIKVCSWYSMDDIPPLTATPLSSDPVRHRDLRDGPQHAC
jgi:hypothetical protein